MKKTFLSIAVLLASIAGVSVSAQTTADATAAKTKTECTKGCAAKGAPAYNPFAGLNLTEQRQSQLQALKTQMKDAKAKEAKTREAAKAERQAQKKQKMEARVQARRDYLAKVKNILTPEQYVQFLENSYVDQGMKQPGGRHGNMAKANRHGKKDQAMRGGKNYKGNKADRRKSKGKMRNQQTAAGQSAVADSTFYIDNGLIKVFPYHAQR